MIGRLCNPNADACAQKLYAHLRAVYGTQILMAQQEFPVTGRNDQEMERIRQVTGCLPAMRGLDFMHDDYAGTVQRARDWHNRGGIVSICWHTGLEGKGYVESQAEKPDFDALFCEGTPEHTLLMSRMSDAADALEQLAQEHIPVLWRPFHEFNGKWFWWGKGGSEHFIRLWRKMYDYFTFDRKLNNLIWVLGFSGEVESEWYPGGDCCDIAGSDTYEIGTTHAKGFGLLQKLCPDKMLAFHECGTMPEVEDFFRDGAVWLWMMPWHNEWLLEKNEPERLKRIYTDTRTLTLEDVKAWK